MGMRLDDLLAKLMDRDGPNKRVPARFAADSGGYLSRARVDSWTRVNPDDIFTTRWGTRATMANAIDPDKVVGIAIAGHVPDLTVWRAVGESVGLRNMWTDADETASLLRAGLHDLTAPRIARLNATTTPSSTSRPGNGGSPSWRPRTRPSARGSRS